MSKREAILAALAAQLGAQLSAPVRRNAALPEKVPAEGLVILRDGEPGEPEVTLNPRREWYRHRIELEAYMSQPAGGGGEAALDALLGAIGSALTADETLGGLAETLVPSAPEIGVLAIEGAAPLLSARIVVAAEYLVSDPLGG
ncbi:MAG: acyl-CoA transferase [Acetobacteraceae bacterium]|nr:acyl-CoA transferase [Acetobacteraceae bacterium]